MKLNFSPNQLQIAANQFQSGNFDYARSLCEKILETQPNNVEAINLIAMVHYYQGKLARAIEVLMLAVERMPEDIRLLNNLGNFLKAAGDFNGARKFYERTLQIDRNCFPARYNLGNVYGALGDSEKAIACYEQALKLEANFPDLHYNLGNELKKQEKIDQAQQAYEAALALNPQHVEALCQLGNCFFARHDFDAAVRAYRGAIACKADSSEARNNLGVVLSRQRQFIEAAEEFSQAVKINPAFLEARNNLGTAQHALGMYDQAVMTFKNLLGRDPGNIDAYRNLARAYSSLGEWDRAAETLKRAVSINPNDYSALLDLGVALTRTEDEWQAPEVFERAQRLKPNWFAPRFNKMMSQLQSFYENESAYTTALAKFDNALEHLNQNFDALAWDSTEQLDEAAASIGSIPPFWLLLFDDNNRERQAKLGAMAVRVMSMKYPQWAEANTREESEKPASGKIKVGIVSQHFKNHSDWRMLVRGWASRLDPVDFQLYGYSTDAPEAGNSSSTKESSADPFTCDFRVYFQSGSLEELAARIAADQIDILIYSSIGSDATPYKLACLRLARVQCAAWAFPMTSGLPTIDFFLGSDLLEGEGAEQHYSETLVRLPNLGSYFRPTIVHPEDKALEQKGLDKSKKIFLCMQSLNKYIPAYDDVLVRIARRMPDAQFIFAFRPEHIKKRLAARLHAVFEANQLDSLQFILFMPALSAEEFAGLCSSAHVFLDTPVNSGCLSTLDAFEQALPVVTIPGKFMRSRHSSGMLQKMGINETIAHDYDEYVEIALRLAEDEVFRKSISEKIVAGRRLLYKDDRAIDGLATFLKTTAAKTIGATQ